MKSGITMKILRWLYMDMKNWKIFVLLAVVLAGAGCEERQEESMPMDVMIFVEDAETGANLLDPEVEGNLLDAEIHAEARGVNYWLQKLPNNASKRPENKDLFSLTLRDWHNSYGGGYHLTFGGFVAESNFRDFLFVLHWADGTTDEFVVNYYSSSGSAERNGVWLNGEKVCEVYDWRVWIKK